MLLAFLHTCQPNRNAPGIAVPEGDKCESEGQRPEKERLRRISERQRRGMERIEWEKIYEPLYRPFRATENGIN